MTSKTLEGYALPVSALQAALVCAAQGDVRYYLNGVYLDFPRGRIVATDGHRLFCGAIPVADCEPVIVPREFAESAVRAWRTMKKREREEAPALIVSVTGQTARCISFGIAARAMMNAQEIDGRFPEYERVIPMEGGDDCGKPGSYNPQYIAECSQALRLYAGLDAKSRRYPFVEQRGPRNAAVLALYDVPALCVVMPMRTDCDEPPSRAWLTAKPAVVPA